MAGENDAPPPDASERFAGAYDRVAAQWRATRPAALYRVVDTLLELALDGISTGARVLDVGCGAGVPITRALAGRGLAVTGLDASARLLEIARVEVPDAFFVHGDVRTIPTSDVGADYDLIVAWDSVFHIPRVDHALVFERFASWLRPGGRLLLSLGGSGGEFTSEMLGETFFYSGFEPDQSLRVLESAGFQILHSEIDDPQSRGHFSIVAESNESA